MGYLRLILLVKDGTHSICLQFISPIFFAFGLGLYKLACQQQHGSEGGHLIQSPARPIRAFVGNSRDYCNVGVWVSGGHNSFVTLADFLTIAPTPLSQHIFHSADKISQSLMSFGLATVLLLTKCFYRDTPQAVDLDQSHTGVHPAFHSDFFCICECIFFDKQWWLVDRLPNIFGNPPRTTFILKFLPQGRWEYCASCPVLDSLGQVHTLVPFITISHPSRRSVEKQKGEVDVVYGVKANWKAQGRACCYCTSSWKSDQFSFNLSSLIIYWSFFSFSLVSCFIQMKWRP